MSFSRIQRSTASPSIPGIRQSSRTASADPPSVKCLSAPAPSLKSVTEKPLSARLSPRDSRNNGSSSTTTTCLVISSVIYLSSRMLFFQAGETTTLGQERSVRALDLIGQRPENPRLYIGIDEHPHGASGTGIAPHLGGRLLGAECRLAEQPGNLGQIEADHLVGVLQCRIAAVGRRLARARVAQGRGRAVGHGRATGRRRYIP